MSIDNQNIPDIPNRPRVRAVPGKIHRSYSVGKQNYSRAFQGQVLTLVIMINWDAPFIGSIQINLQTTMDSVNDEIWNIVPFYSVDSRTWMCQVMAVKRGLHSYRAEFSFDNGTSWVRDSVADSWVLIDPPQVDGLRLYTVIPNVSGSVSDWIKDLSRIHDMGFNAIHLLPLTMLDISESPYSAKDLFSIDPRYLDPNSPLNGEQQLDELVKAAKALNIGLCFDLVLNHVGVNSNIAKKAPDWIVPDLNKPDGFQRARYLTDQGWHFWDDLILINYEHPSEAIRTEIWSYMTNYMLFWAKYANATGGFLRFDNLHSSNADFVLFLTKTLHSKYPQVGILAEYFTDEATLAQNGLKWGVSINLATPWDHKFVPRLREYLKYIHRVSRQIRYYMPVTSHDSGSPAQEFGGAESTIPRYVAAALLGTGATGIVQGVEFGNKEKINFIGKKQKMLYPAEPMFTGFIKRVNTILADYPAFRRGGNCRFVDDDHHAIIAAFRQEKGTDTFGFLVVCNFDILSPQHIAIDLGHFLGKGKPVSCYDLLSDKKFNFSNSIMNLSLPPCKVLVLKILQY